MSNIVEAMLFDLDGTLLDSAPDLVAALNWVRETEQLTPLSIAKMSPFASKGAVGLLEAGMPSTDPDTFASWRQRFLEYYRLHSYEHSSLYQGVPDLLKRLDDAGVGWGIVTNKPEYLTHPIIEAAGLQQRIGCVVCGDTLSQSKPDPAPVRLACEIVGVAPAAAVFAGDDVRDIQAGTAAGTRTAAVHYGYGSHELVGQLVADSFPVHHPADLLGLLD